MATDDSTDITDNIADGSSDPQRHIFRFFDLPQELRDEVYDMSLADQVGRLECGLIMTATNIAPTSKLLVSKEFSHEYQMRAQKMSQVTITDTDVWTDRRAMTFPPAVANVRMIKVELLCMEKQEAWAHKSWLEDLIKRAKHPLALSIRLHYAHPIAKDVNEGLFGDWAQLEGLAQLKIYIRHSQDSAFRFDGEDGLHFEWSSTTGMLEENIAESGD